MIRVRRPIRWMRCGVAGPLFLKLLKQTRSFFSRFRTFMIANDGLHLLHLRCVSLFRLNKHFRKSQATFHYGIGFRFFYVFSGSIHL